MTRLRSLALLALVLIVTGEASAQHALSPATGVAAADSPEATPRSAAPAVAPTLADYGKLPLIFEPFADPVDGATRYIARGRGYGMAVSARGLQIAAYGPAATPGPPMTVALDFIGVDPHAGVEGVGLQATRIHRFKSGGDATNLPTYAGVRVSGAYPQIDIVHYGHGGRLEYDVIVAAGGDPSLFGLRVDSSGTLSLDAAGDLLVTADGGTFRLHRPLAYQVLDGSRVGVDSAFTLENGRDVRIRVGEYDRTRTLVIDPIISYATYLGGNSFEQGTAIAVDAGGNAFITGYTMSTDFPTVSAYDRSLGKSGDVDVFVSKLNAAGTALVWSTYLGGAGSADRAVGIAVDAAGSAYVTGQTAAGNFPVSGTAWQKASSTGGSFVSKLGPAGNTLAYSTYIVGATSSAIAVDSSGNAYVVGSATPAFTTTPGALQPAPGSAATGFVVKLDATGNAPAYSTFLGGNGNDQATTVAVDGRGNAYVAGWTTSSNFPAQNAIQATPRGQKDAFIAKLDATGSRLTYATLLGGLLDDAVHAIAIDGTGHAYVAGETYSPDFPTKGGFQPFKAGSNLVNSSVGNAFIAKLAPTGTALVYSSFLGGEVCKTPCQVVFGSLPQYRGDAAFGVAVDAAGHAYVTGIARSYTFPLVDSPARRKQEDSEDSAFVTKVGVAGSMLLWSTFLRTGFNEADNHWTRFPPGAATGIALDPSGAAYVTGDADSYSDFLPTPGALQTTNSNGQGAVVVKFARTPSLTLTSSNNSVDSQTPITLTATLDGPAIASEVTFLSGSAWIGTAQLTGNQATLVTTLPAGIHALTALIRVPGDAATTPVIYQVVDTPLACN